VNTAIKVVLFFWLALCSGCATQQIDHVLSNLDADCSRHYAGQAGGMAASFSFTIDCQPGGTVTTTTVTTPQKTP
jgi:hypothetical protein